MNINLPIYDLPFSQCAKISRRRLNRSDIPVTCFVASVALLCLGKEKGKKKGRISILAIFCLCGNHRVAMAGCGMGYYCDGIGIFLSDRVEIVLHDEWQVL